MRTFLSYACLNIKKNFTTSSISTNIRSEAYQYLQQSKVPTLHFQKSLPRLPIPALHKSCERYLRAQKAITTPQEFSVIEKIVKNFETKDGPPLHRELQHMDSLHKNTSYISAPWFEMYLKDRKALPINYNPFLVFINDPKPEYNGQLIRATNLLISSLRFMKAFRKNLLEPEVYHLDSKKSNTELFRTITGFLPQSLSWYGAYLFNAYPLDMSQYYNLFNTSRIPGEKIDRLFHDPSARHIMVMKNGFIYKVNVLDESGYILSPNDIYASLKYIFTRNQEHNDHPVGVLTTLRRNIWSSNRKYLEDIGNKVVLNDIDSSIMCLIFDTEEPTTDYKELIHRYLHSNGTNRWFDKSFSLIVQKNGIAGLNFEHSWGDGVAVLRYFNEIFQDSTENPHIHPATKIEPTSTFVNELDFILDDVSKKFIGSAKDSYKRVFSSLGVEVVEFLEFGRLLCKKHNISPDSLMQLAFQMAHYKLTRKFVSTYESCSTAAFKHGRTETIRPCTLETKALAETLFSNEEFNNKGVLQMMKECSSVHGNLIKEAAMGHGFDRHMFVLQLLAEKNSKKIELFTHPFHKNFNYFVMSTSTLSSDNVMLGAFGPVVQDGFGIGYTIRNNMLGSIISYYTNEADGPGFSNCLKDSLHILHSVLK